MSTRSGKRIHNSSIDKIDTMNVSEVANNDNKKRGRKHKENNIELNLSVPRKMRSNYVSFPTDDEDPAPTSPKYTKLTRSLRKNTILTELNFDTVIKNTKNDTLKDQGVVAEEIISAKRKPKKLLIENNEQETQTNEKRKKKNKKNKTSLENAREKGISQNDSGSLPVNKHKKKKIKKSKNSSTDSVNCDILKADITEVGKSIMSNNSSMDSFHSAAGSTESLFKDIHDNVHNETFDKAPGTCQKLDITFDKDNDKKSSLISSDTPDSKEGTINVTFDKSDCSKISITSDESKASIDNIMNATPVLIESSMDASIEHNISKDISIKSPIEIIELQSPIKSPIEVIGLRREGTFTKDGPDPIIMSPKQKTPVKCNISLPAPGSTPYHSNSKKREKSVNLNLTHSIEKPKGRRSSCIDNVQRMTKVMFCSPVDNPTLVSKRKSRVIKSSIKGSNKSFVFDDNESAVKAGTRKRSYTHNDAEDIRVKRTRLCGEDLENSINRLSKPRTSSTKEHFTVKPNEPITPLKKIPTPYLSKSVESKSVRGKLPNFAVLHKKQFEKMESLDECQMRKAKRARQLLSPSGSLTVLERKGKKSSPEVVKPTTTAPKKLETPKKVATPSIPLVSNIRTLDSLRPGFTRFGFKMNYDVNPFSVPPKIESKVNNTISNIKMDNINGNPKLKREKSQPSLFGTTSSRKVLAKQTVLREKSSTGLKEKRDFKRNENRTIIKGVRTNRRFELQMKSRNMNI